MTNAARQRFDYIVVGGGSAGCVIAARLSEDPTTTVLLVESGPSDLTPAVRIPAAFFRLYGTNRRWEYLAEPAAAAAGRRIPVPQGRTLGGGSSVNGMIYIRGQREDYDEWAREGCQGWSYDDVLPYFRRSERNQRLSGLYHGTQGPLRVSDPARPHPLSFALIKAAMEMGAVAGRPVRYNPDFNGESQEGVGLYQVTIGDGLRSSTATAFLHPVRGRPNLTVWASAHVHRVLVEPTPESAAAGLRAIGVAYSLGDESGPERTVLATREVIVTAGAIATPKVLMLSGLGPAEHLRAHGVPVLADVPELGSNYHDHLTISAMGRLKAPISLHGHDRGLRALRHLAEWTVLRSGVLASNVLEAGGFFDLDGDSRPEIQTHLVPRLPYAPGQPGGEHGLTVSAHALALESRGRVGLRNADPRSHPLLNSGYLDKAEDVRALVGAFKLARRHLQSPAIADLIEAEIGPGAQVSDDDLEGLERLVRAEARTVYHPVGTCRMGSDARAVVDPQLRFRGVEGLRVADASVMPRIVRGNTNAPTIMIAERAVDFIRGKVLDARKVEAGPAKHTTTSGARGRPARALVQVASALRAAAQKG